MTRTVDEIREAVLSREEDGQDVEAIVMSMSTALAITVELYAHMGSSTLYPESLMRQPSLFGYVVLIKEEIPHGEWVISSRRRSSWKR